MLLTLRLQKLRLQKSFSAGFLLFAQSCAHFYHYVLCKNCAITYQHLGNRGKYEKLHSERFFCYPKVSNWSKFGVSSLNARGWQNFLKKILFFFMFLIYFHIFPDNRENIKIWRSIQRGKIFKFRKKFLFKVHNLYFYKHQKPIFLSEIPFLDKSCFCWFWPFLVIFGLVYFILVGYRNFSPSFLFFFVLLCFFLFFFFL